MLNVIARLLLTATALAPVGLTYAWVAGVQGDWAAAIIIGAITASLFSVCVLILILAPNHIASSDFKAKTVEAADHENTAFMLLYVMPLFTSQFSTLNWQFWIPTIFIFVIITATGYNYHFNPMLGMLGWHFYKVESEEGVVFVLITKKQLRSAAGTIKVGQLTEYILIDFGGK